jgi:hypothetical protein
MTEELEKYEVFFRDPLTNDHWSYFFQAESFAHAEEQAWDAEDSGGQIIRIERDYE